MNALDPIQTKQLVKRCQQGDRQAFNELVLHEQSRIHRLVFHIVQRREDVDDLVQDIFLQLYRKIQSFRFESTFSTWLTRLAINECRKSLRRRRFNRVLFGLDKDWTDEIREDSPLQLLEQEEYKQVLGKALQRLPTKQRIVLVLRYFEELSCEQIAAVLKCRLGTVHSRLFNGRQRLKDLLLAREVI